MGPGEHLLEVGQRGHHSDNVILDVAKIKSNVHARGDFIVVVASLGKSFEDVRLAAQKLHQTHDVLADHANLAQKSLHVVIASNEDLVFNQIGFNLNLGDDGCECVDNVITAHMLEFGK